MTTRIEGTFANESATMMYLAPQVIERLDTESVMAALDGDNITSDTVKDLFAGLSEKAKKSTTRVARLPSGQLSLAELKSLKERLDTKLQHLHSTGVLFDAKGAEDLNQV